MKKKLLIILGFILVILGAVWIYLMLFGTPTSLDDVWADLGFATEEVPFEPTAPEPDRERLPSDQNLSSDGPNPLTRLTLRPTIGAVIYGSSTGSQKVRFTERGLGIHYEIDVAAQTETKISHDVLTQATEAIWSPDGRFVVVRHQVDNNPFLTLFDLGDSSSGTPQTITSPLPPDATELGFSTDSSHLYYVRADEKGTIGYRYAVDKLEREVWFSTPFHHIAVDWDDETPLIYNRPGERYQGFAYRLIDGELARVSASGESLVAFAHGDNAIVTRVEEGLQHSYYVINGQEKALTAPVQPEKCADASLFENTILCGVHSGSSALMPVNWYKGLTTLEDMFVAIDIDTGASFFVANLTELSGQFIDVINMMSDPTGLKLVFRDKTTFGLWMYDTTITPNSNRVLE